MREIVAYDSILSHLKRAFYTQMREMQGITNYENNALWIKQD